MHSKSNNREITTAVNKDEIIRELFNFLSDRYQAGLEQMMIGSDFALLLCQWFFYKCHEISLNRGGYCIGSPE